MRCAIAAGTSSCSSNVTHRKTTPNSPGASLEIFSECDRPGWINIPSSSTPEKETSDFCAASAATTSMRVNAYSHLSMFEMCSSYTRCHFPSALNAVGAMGITALNSGVTGRGVCSALGAAGAGGAPVSALRVKSSACAATPFCVQLPVISRLFFFNLPSYKPPTAATSKCTASLRSVTLLRGSTTCWSTLLSVPPSSPLSDLLIVTSKWSLPPSTPAHTPSIPFLESAAWPIVPAAISKYVNAAIKQNATFVEIFIFILRTGNQLQNFFFCDLCAPAVIASAPNLMTTAGILVTILERRVRDCSFRTHRPSTFGKVAGGAQGIQIQGPGAGPMLALVQTYILALRPDGHQIRVRDPSHGRAKSSGLPRRGMPSCALIERIRRDPVMHFHFFVITAHRDDAVAR